MESSIYNIQRIEWLKLMGFYDTSRIVALSEYMYQPYNNFFDMYVNYKKWRIFVRTGRF